MAATIYQGPTPPGTPVTLTFPGAWDLPAGQFLQSVQVDAGSKLTVKNGSGFATVFSGPYSGVVPPDLQISRIELEVNAASAGVPSGYSTTPTYPGQKPKYFDRATGRYLYEVGMPLWDQRPRVRRSSGGLFDGLGGMSPLLLMMLSGLGGGGD